jgi:hypothetical protein
MRHWYNRTDEEQTTLSDAENRKTVTASAFS